jgi:accessory gene regulator protein AgrB
MKKKTNSGEETIKSIRRNSAYNSSRTLVLIFCVVLGLSMLATAYWLSQNLPQNAQITVLFIAVLLGVLSGVNLFHFLHAHYDQSDALIQVAKFQERSLKHRNNALSLVEKIRQEVDEENQQEQKVRAFVQDETIDPIEKPSEEENQ